MATESCTVLTPHEQYRNTQLVEDTEFTKTNGTAAPIFVEITAQ